MELARQLRAKREERGLSQDEVSKAIFVSRQTISNWENDKTYPDVQSLLLLSQLFEVSIAWPEPSGFARMSKGNLAGAATFIVLYAIGFAMAIGVDRLKKKHDVVTYREIDRFLKGEVAPEPDTEGLARKHPALGVLVKLFAGASIGLLLAGLLLALEG